MRILIPQMGNSLVSFGGLRKLLLCLQAVLLLILPGSLCHAQKPPEYKHIFQGAIRDHSGNLWFGTTGIGVFRYANGKFTNYTEADGLISNYCTSIYEDRAGKIWFSASNGICRYDPVTGKFNRYAIKGGLCSMDIGSILEDQKGNFWFGTSGYGICRVDAASAESRNYTTDDGLGSNFIQCIFQDKSGNIWVGERAGGVSRYDPDSNKFIRIGGPGLSSQIMGILEDRHGNIWFANLYSGISRYNLSTKTVAHYSTSEGICSDTITCIYEDSKGNLWLGNDTKGGLTKGSGGVCRFDPQSRESKYFSVKDGLCNNDVWTIVEDIEGRIWFGTRAGGLCTYDPVAGTFRDFSREAFESE